MVSNDIRYSDGLYDKVNDVRPRTKFKRERNYVINGSRTHLSFRYDWLVYW